MARKRAPGGGRKPIDGTPRSATLTVRLGKELREALEREARRNQRRLSGEVFNRLRDSLLMAETLERLFGKSHNYALARIVSMLAQRAEGATGVKWRDDAFTFQLLRLTIDAVMVQLAPAAWSPDGPFEVPEVVEKSAAMITRHRPDLAEMHRRPDALASSIALGFLDMLDTYDLPPEVHPSNVRYAEEFSTMPRLRKALGLDQ